VYVATNLLDTMMTSLKPSRAEINDIINTLVDGADGLVLAAETAIGDHPVESVTLIRTLCEQMEEVRKWGKDKTISRNELISFIDRSNYLTRATAGNGLIEPHGGKLVHQVTRTTDIDHSDLRTIEISTNEAMDAEQIAIGTYSPLEGFLCRDDFKSVVHTMRLADGIIWPIPIILQVNEEDIKGLSVGTQILLCEKNTGRKVATLDVEDIFEIDLPIIVKSLFATDDPAHPGVAKMLAKGRFIIGGKVTLLSRSDNPHKFYEFTPAQTRKIFESRGWSKVVGFHSRNPIHRGHEYIQRTAFKEQKCDGMFLHPVVGEKKAGDFSTNVILKSYEIMMREFYPVDQAILGTFATYSRYMGPREALFTALCRQNYGCSHFIVGRDHTGVGDYYAATASKDIFEQFHDLKIKLVPFSQVSYCEELGRHVEEDKCNIENPTFRTISGTKVREMFAEGIRPPGWFMRTEISKEIMGRIELGEKVFVEETPASQKPAAKVLWFTGYSGSGKTTIASKLKDVLESEGKSVLVLDGDDIRNSVHKHLGFTPADIKENNTLIAQMASEKMSDYDYILVPIIAPFRESRLNARKKIGPTFTEIFVDVPLKECIKRDPKGLYKKVEAGEIDNFIGVCDQVPYEEPLSPEIKVNTTSDSVEESVAQIVRSVL